MIGTRIYESCESILGSLRTAPILSLIYHYRRESDSVGDGSCRGIADIHTPRQIAVYYIGQSDLQVSLVPPACQCDRP
jgi:hypothetical protein